MRFLEPDALKWLFAVVPVFIVFAFIAARLREKKLSKLFASPENAEKFSSLSKGARRTGTSLFFLSAVLLVIAAARPSWGSRIIPDTASGRDLLFVFDVSKSMLSDDVAPSRLEHAKWLVRELVKANPGDRFGLIAFAGNAFLECPLTTDTETFTQVVNELSVNTIPLGGTNIEAALAVAEEAFNAAEGDNRAVILITDGDELAGKSESVIKRFAENHVPVFAVGIGDPSKPAVIRVPDEDGRFSILKDGNGNAVVPKLDEKVLAAIAVGTGGTYVRSTAGASGLEELEERIKLLDAKERGETLETVRPIERSIYPLALAIVCLSAALLISERGRKKDFSKLETFFVVFSLLFLNPLQAFSADDEDGKLHLQKDVVHETTPAIFYNTALQMQNENKKENREKVVEAYSLAIASSEKEPSVRAGAYQNLGVIDHSDARKLMTEADGQVKAQNLDEAEKDLSSALDALGKAEEAYKESMRCSESVPPPVAANQSLLLKDREKVLELQKKIEELKKLRDEAEKQAKQAQSEQKKKNEEKRDDKSERNKDGAQKQQEHQDGKGSENKSSAERAADTAKELSQKSYSLGQSKMKEKADKAADELEKAAGEQKKGNGKEAQKHLDEAVKALSDGDKDGNGQDKKDDDGKREKDKSGKKTDNEQPSDGRKNKPEPSGQQSGNNDEKGKKENVSGAEERNGSMDKDQAEALLKSMANDEKDLRDAVKDAQMKNMRLKQPEKDW